MCPSKLSLAYATSAPRTLIVETALKNFVRTSLTRFFAAARSLLETITAMELCDEGSA
jgi:hypothetical protein